MSIKLQAFHGTDSSWTQIGTDIEYGTTNKITLNTAGKRCLDKIKISLSGIEDWDGSLVLLPRVGGRIFYDAGSNGATYTFYDVSGNVLPTQTVEGLANAVYYSIEGTPTKDRWYVYDTAGLTSNLYWGYFGTDTGATSNTIGSGKTNTQIIFTRGVPTDLTPNIWSFTKSKRDTNYNGCNDWFIASKAEQDQLRSSGLVNWYSSKYIWSSVEYTANFAYVWDYRDSFWYGDYKSTSGCGFAARAF